MTAEPTRTDETTAPDMPDSALLYDAAESQDCKSETGITTGLIDSLISICRVLAKRQLAQAREALADLTADEDVAAIFAASPQHRWREHIADEIAAISRRQRRGLAEDEAYNEALARAEDVARGVS